jgi:hypothetical protein
MGQTLRKGMVWRKISNQLLEVQFICLHYETVETPNLLTQRSIRVGQPTQRVNEQAPAEPPIPLQPQTPRVPRVCANARGVWARGLGRCRVLARVCAYVCRDLRLAGAPFSLNLIFKLKKLAVVIWL